EIVRVALRKGGSRLRAARDYPFGTEVAQRVGPVRSGHDGRGCLRICLSNALNLRFVGADDSPPDIGKGAICPPQKFTHWRTSQSMSTNPKMPSETNPLSV